MSLTPILSEEELLALLVSNDEKLQKAEAPPVRIERHHCHTCHVVDARPHFLDSDQQDIKILLSSDSEDESELPPGYYDESDDDVDVSYECGSPHFASAAVQPSSLDIGFREEDYGGVLVAAAAEFLPPQFISPGNASLVEGCVDQVNNDYMITLTLLTLTAEMSTAVMMLLRKSMKDCASDSDGGAGYASGDGYSSG
ncbi:hypothetical protein CYMTET_4633 [Cymbomonas tetramitiformis]|uniref:Uncharacterized protein n=1 Tax=Cymbomonas tetramitiformis TaxID=36881 RepID=A0AAE0LKA9_9CHLO|nr:hypothetical protein CYMTET_4633 [Cymbomonas tetramitiformis]